MSIYGGFDFGTGCVSDFDFDIPERTAIMLKNHLGCARDIIRGHCLGGWWHVGYCTDRNKFGLSGN